MGVTVGVCVGVFVWVWVGELVAVCVALRVAVSVALAVAVWVGVRVRVAVSVGVRVAVRVGVRVAVRVGVRVGVRVRVGVKVRVGIGVGRETQRPWIQIVPAGHSSSQIQSAAAPKSPVQWPCPSHRSFTVSGLRSSQLLPHCVPVCSQRFRVSSQRSLVQGLRSPHVRVVRTHTKKMQLSAVQNRPSSQSSSLRH